MLVELDDDPGPPAPQRRTDRARRRWPAALPAVVVLALVVAQLAADARERVRLAALADVPGVLAPLPDPPAVAWRLSADATGDVLVHGDLLLEERVTSRGAMSLVARDLTSGDVRWAVPLADEPDPPVPGRYGLRCVAGPGTQVTCLVHDATDGDATGGARAPGRAATEGTVVVVAVDDGSVPGLALTTGGGLRAWDARTGEERWRVTAPTQGALVLGGLVHVHDGFRVATLAAGTGEVRWEVTAPELFHDDVAQVTGLATDGRRLLVAGVQRATGNARLVALDPADGVVVWRADLDGLGAPGDVAAVDGVLLGTGAQGTAVLASRGRRAGQAGGRRTSQRASRRSSAARDGVR